MTDLSGIQSALAGAVHDLVDGLLSDLLGFGPNQHTRLLRLHTPLGPNVLLAERARITEGIGPRQAEPAFAIELLALSTNAGIQPTDLIGQPVLLELLTAHSTTELRPFHGHILGFELLGSDGGYARYRLQIGAWLDFLRHRTDAWIFQGQSVVEITEAIFADYAAQGTLQPKWRWDLKDQAVYPQLSTLSQHDETDFDFLQRLWAANGLFCWFEHTGDASDAATLGNHTLVIADHNGAFTANQQGRIRFTQPGAVMKEDSITRWHGKRRIGVTTLNTASFDYRSVANHAASTEVDAAHEQPMPLVHTDQPGAYAYETPAEVERLATVYLQSLQAQRKQFDGRATVRTLAPASTFTLLDHAEHDADLLQGGDDAARFVVLGVVHTARNNMSADAKAGLQHLLGHALLGGEHAPTKDAAAGNTSTEPLYEARFEAQRASVAVRPALTDGQGTLLHPKPTVWGTQTALVVGLDGPIHTDRDGRVKVQFHWQRGAGSSHRLSSSGGDSGGDNAPASDASGTWVRVAQDWAGQNWGGVFVPCLGQEVVVAFLDGDIDRPLIVGQLHNGPHELPWPAGVDAGTNHPGTISGWHHPHLDGQGANQWVVDDATGQLRMRLASHSSATGHSELTLGHLIQQSARGGSGAAQRGQWLGEGFYGHTEGWAVVRAGEGLLLTTSARPARGASVARTQMDASEAVGQLKAAQQLGDVLAQSARQQGAHGLHSHESGQAWATHTEAMDPAAQGKHSGAVGGQDARQATVELCDGSAAALLPRGRADLLLQVLLRGLAPGGVALARLRRLRRRVSATSSPRFPSIAPSLAEPPLLALIPPFDELASAVIRLGFYDDDGDLANGTPNECEINLAFAAHGLLSAGGVTGKMISPQSIAVACAAVGLVGKESDLFRFTVKHSLLFATMVGIITTLQAYVFTWMIP